MKEKKVKSEVSPAAEGFKKELGFRLKFLRKRQRMTQAQTANNLGMNYRHYQDIEAGKSDLKVSSLIKIAGFFQMPLDQLVDIGDQTTMACPLELVEKSFREIGNYFLAPLALRDMNGKVITANKAALALGKFEAKDVEGVSIFDLCPTQLSDFYRNLVQAEKNGQFRCTVYHFYNKDKELAKVHYHPIPIIGKSGEPSGVLALSTPAAFDFEAPPKF